MDWIAFLKMNQYLNDQQLFRTVIVSIVKGRLLSHWLYGDRMRKCSRCGNNIEFRYVDGRCIPMHSDGGCIGEGNFTVNDYSGHKVRPALKVFFKLSNKKQSPL